MSVDNLLHGKPHSFWLYPIKKRSANFFPYVLTANSSKLLIFLLWFFIFKNNNLVNSIHEYLKPRNLNKFQGDNGKSMFSKLHTFKE